MVGLRLLRIMSVGAGWTRLVQPLQGLANAVLAAEERR
jgi:hypothetical protein